jgi:predicted NBD/HSP70 family sugar kinase
VRVTLHNDMDALASSDAAATDPDGSLVYVGFGEGLKFALMFDGVPYAGPFGNAGLVAPPLMAEGASQADRSLLQVHGLVDAYVQRRGETQAPDTQRRSPQAVRAEFAAILNAADAGEADATELTFRMTDLVAAQAASFVHLLQPGLLVLGGALAGAPPGIARRIEQGIRARLPALINNHLAMRPATVTAGNGTAVGATRAFLQAHLDRATERQPLPARL